MKTSVAVLVAVLAAGVASAQVPQPVPTPTGEQFAPSSQAAPAKSPDAELKSGPRIATTQTLNEPLVVNDTITATSTLQDKPRLLLLGQEYYSSSGDTANGMALLMGYNRTNDRQLWFADSTRLTRNSTNPAFRISIADQFPILSGVSTDGTTPKNLAINPWGANVTIGYAPAYPAKFFVLNSSAGVPSQVTQQQVTYSANAASNDRALVGVTYANVNAGVTNTGNAKGIEGSVYALGSGALTSATGLHGMILVNPPSTTSLTNAFGVYSYVHKNTGAIANGYGFYVAEVDAATGYGMYIEDLASANAYGIYQKGATDANYFAGNVAIGGAATSRKLEVYGDATFSGTVTGGNIQAKYQDVAEWVPSNGDLAPGTVVVLDPAVGNGVMPSSTAYDTSVAGVVSDQPGILLGEGGASKEKVATTGRVRVRVDATKAPIRVGDLLVTSDRPGVAMKSIPVDLGGVSIHRPGTIIGKALQPLAEGEAEILVLLSLQ